MRTFFISFNLSNPFNLLTRSSHPALITVIAVIALGGGLAGASETDWSPNPWAVSDERLNALPALPGLAGLNQLQRFPYGQFILHTSHDSQARRIGLQVGDLLLGIDDQHVGFTDSTEAFNLLRRSHPQQLHWWSPLSGLNSALIQPGLVGFNSSPDPFINPYLLLGHSETAAAPEELLRIAYFAQRDPDAAEALLARYMQQHPAHPRMGLIWALILHHRGDHREFFEHIRNLDADLEDSLQYALITMGYRSAAFLGRRDMLNFLRRTHRNLEIDEVYRRIVQHTPRIHPLSPPWRESLLFTDRTSQLEILGSHPERARDILLARSYRYEIPLGRYGREDFRFPAHLHQPDDGHRLSFRVRVVAAQGESRFFGTLWFIVFPQASEPSARYELSLLGSGHRPSSLIEIKGPEGLELTRPRSQPGDHWHAVEIWMYRQRLDMVMDGKLMRTFALPMAINRPWVRFHNQSATVHATDLNWHSFRIYAEHADQQP